uniref:Glutaredoxin domain-containing protein n=1 Tax=viral metagenome TaxID=1070528 RepID=A0A6C0HTF6_9ZZZZ
MAEILYYSNFCEHSKKILQILSKTQLKDKFHFICIDKRVVEDNKVFVVLQNGNKIIMPNNITKVPAILNLTTYNVIVGDDIYDYLKPQNQEITKNATSNNMEPFSFAFTGNTGAGVLSDNFSFLDTSSESLMAEGDGGLRQMYSYASANFQNQAVPINTPSDEFGARKNGLTMEQLQKQRDMDIKR